MKPNGKVSDSHGREPFEKTKGTQTLEKADSRAALAVNWTDRLYLHIFLNKEITKYS